MISEDQLVQNAKHEVLPLCIERFGEEHELTQKLASCQSTQRDELDLKKTMSEDSGSLAV